LAAALLLQVRTTPPRPRCHYPHRCLHRRLKHHPSKSQLQPMCVATHPPSLPPHWLAVVGCSAGC